MVMVITPTQNSGILLLVHTLTYLSQISYIAVKVWAWISYYILYKIIVSSFIHVLIVVDIF